MTTEDAGLANQKAILLRAWRERWPDVKWSVAAKKSKFEAKALAELMIQQATIGVCPNILLMSYFKHALATQMVPVVAGMEAVMKIEDMNKIYCIKGLVEVMDSMTPYIWIQSQDPLVQAHTALRTIRWLLSITERCLSRLASDSQVAEHSTVISKNAALLSKMLSNQELKALLYVAQNSKHDIYSQIISLCTSVETNCKSCQHISPYNKVKVDAAIQLVKSLSTPPIHDKLILDVSQVSLNPAITSLLCTSTLLHPLMTPAYLCNQLRIIQKLQGISLQALNDKLLRATFLAMIDSADTNDASKWAAFLLLKLGRVLVLLNGDSGTQHLEESLDKLLDTPAILDQTELKCGADAFLLLLKELSKQQLISESSLRKLESRRKSDSLSLSDNRTQSYCHMILRAEPTLQGCLEAMSRDYSRNMTELIAVLSRLISGRSLELVTLAAAATGTLSQFARHMISFNELSRTATGESGSQAQSRAILFDMTFLILCHFTLTFDLQVLDEHTQKDSFFVQWAKQHLPTRGNQFSAPDTTVTENNRVDALISQVYPNSDLRTNMARWSDVCYTVKAVSEEVLYAWHQGALSNDQVKTIVVNLTSRMTCLGIVMTVHLCSLLRTSEKAFRNRIQTFLDYIVEPQQDVNQQSTTYHSERHQLMLSIIFHNFGRSLSMLHILYHDPNYFAQDELPLVSLREVLQTLGPQLSGHNCLRLEVLLHRCGPKWFCQNLVQELLQYDRPEDLSRAMSLAYGLMTMNVDVLTHALIQNTLPWLLSQQHLLSECRVHVLAKLVVMCLVRWKNTQAKDNGQSERKRKRSGSDPTEDMDDLPAAKLRRLTDSVGMCSTDTLRDDSSSDSVPDSAHSLNNALSYLGNLCLSILSTGQLTHATVFIEYFLHEVVASGYSKDLLYPLSSSLVVQLIQLLPRSLPLDIMLSSCNLSTTEGCITAARLICQNIRRVNGPLRIGISSTMQSAPATV